MISAALRDQLPTHLKFPHYSGMMKNVSAASMRRRIVRRVEYYKK